MDFQFESLGPTLSIVVLIFLIGFALVLLGLVVVLAALPGHVARSRNHAQADAVNICGWLGLPTGILWVLAMVWAYIRSPSDADRESTASVDPKQIAKQIAALEQTMTTLESVQAGANQ